LPNKFFEFIQARLAVAIGPSPEMARLATRHGFGIVARSFEPQELAGCISALSAMDIERLKHQADQASHELHAGRSTEILLAEVQRLVV
jgi:alkanesulfonate monooxygenase SsuD/methylene tetrahydromethanopterin reductase-like flavin-dependent oxidoreductase (luciferase family)